MGDRNYHSSNVAHSVNTNNFITNTANDTAEIMQWLSPLETRNRYQDVRSDQFDGVGNWLLETNQFRERRSAQGGADKAVLFCHWNPGVGKTFLQCVTKFCLDTKESIFNANPHYFHGYGEEDNIAVAGVYCDFPEEKEQTTTNVMGAILKQLVLQESSIVGSISMALAKAKDECDGDTHNFGIISQC
ncbi:hypothetical protein L873DRAFT_1824652 [Choiromyces venosus 120613-1]|uniref:Nephrocystin 3-like N-terminal domain-containing protein n=1 Tax=Choiromyces venosus 120613-1 TaxID=1336337 RepID=A0A3N4IVQ2_9PEZI|nr:hypothetical protein L873DRAFT_1824652 [Choiromyces venosus 120613-1]